MSGINVPAKTWPAFLEAEIAATKDEFFTQELLLILQEYLGASHCTAEFAADAASAIDELYDDFLLDPHSAFKFSSREDMESFLWLVCGALLELVGRMQGLDRDRAKISTLVNELKKCPAKEYSVAGVCHRA